MAQLSPTRGADRIEYQAVSGFAIASFAIGAGFAFTLLVLMVMSYMRNTQLLMGAWVLAIPLLAILLSLFAKHRIYRSEGTLTGDRLAHFSLIISFLAGLGYGLYQATTFYTVCHIQAPSFVEKFFKKLRDPEEVNAAFLDTLPPEARTNTQPDAKREMMIRFGFTGEDQKKGALLSFAEHDIVRILHAAGSHAKIEFQGVRGWEYIADAYRVTLAYRATTDEGTFDFLLTAQGRDTPQGRKWMLVWNEENAKLEKYVFTEKANFVRQWRASVPKFLTEAYIFPRLDPTRDHSILCYLATLPPAEREPALHRYQAGFAAMLMTAPASALANPVPGCAAAILNYLPNIPSTRDLLLPEFDARTYKILDTEPFIGMTGDLHDHLPGEMRRWFRNPRELATRLQFLPQQSFMGPPKLLKMDLDTGVVQYAQECAMGLFRKPFDIKHPTMPDICEFNFIVESDPGPIEAGRDPGWRLVKIELLRCRNQEMPKPPGPGGR